MLQQGYARQCNSNTTTPHQQVGARLPPELDPGIVRIGQLICAAVSCEVFHLQSTDAQQVDATMSALGITMTKFALMLATSFVCSRLVAFCCCWR